MVISGSNWECYEPCPASQYYKHSVWDCLNCHASCATCFYENTVAHCATCAAGMSKLPGTNYCRVPSVCPLGTYRDATRNCVPCPGGSQHCTTGGLHIGSFTPYSSVTNGVQTACTAPCATCSPAPTDCLDLHHGHARRQPLLPEVQLGLLRPGHRQLRPCRPHQPLLARRLAHLHR
jgi:hypothetical protein